MFVSHKIRKVRHNRCLPWKTRGVTIKNRSELLRKYSGMSITEALETTKQRFIMLEPRLTKYTRKKTREAQVNTIIALIPPNTIYSATPAAMQKYNKNRPTKSWIWRLLEEHKGETIIIYHWCSEGNRSEGRPTFSQSRNQHSCSHSRTGTELERIGSYEGLRFIPSYSNKQYRMMVSRSPRRMIFRK